MSGRAIFISFEGPDGSGKSTQARMLANALRERGYPVTATREPGGTPVGEGVRTLLLDPNSPPATPLVMALLLGASRAQLAETVIRPSLAAGQLVIVDRWADSTEAYQGYGLGLDLETVRDLRRIATGGTEPDITVYVDVRPEIGLSRIAARGDRNKLDLKTHSFHERVRKGYLQMMQPNSPRWVAVEGEAGVDTVHRTILDRVVPMLEAPE